MTAPGPIDTRRTLPLPGAADPALVLTPARRGLYLCNRHDIVGYALMEFGEWAEPEAALLTALLRPGDNAIECGAHVGTLTIPMARAVAPQGAIHALEAQPYFGRLLNANLALNGIGNAVTHHFVVGRDRGIVRLPPIEYDKRVNFAGLSLAALPTDGSGRGTALPVRTLDALFGGLDRLQLIKLDIEEMEPEALAGAVGLLDRFQPVVYCEARTAPTFAAVRDILAARGYKLYWHAFRGYNPNNYRGNPANRFGAQGDVNLLALPPGMGEPARGLPPATDFADVERIWPGILGSGAQGSGAQDQGGAAD